MRAPGPGWGQTARELRRRESGITVILGSGDSHGVWVHGLRLLEGSGVFLGAVPGQEWTRRHIRGQTAVGTQNSLDVGF